MKISTGIKTYASLIMAMLFWSISYILYKQVYEYFQPITTVIFRLIISSIFMYLLIRILRRSRKIERKDFRWFLLSAFFEPFLYFLGESMGVQLVTPTLAALIIATIPLFAPLAGIVLLNEKLSRLNIAGIILSVGGVSFVIIENHQANGSSVTGILFMFLAVFAAVGYSMVIKRLTQKYKPLFIVYVQNMIGILYFFPLFLIFDYNQLKETSFTLPALTPLLKLSIFASAFAYIFFTYGISKVGVARASVFGNFIPVFTAFFAWYYLNETITLMKAVGISLVILGLLFTQVSIKNKISF
ncbi:MAG: DMT family transporter [Bacteroidales bacterium]